jgi:hypothetical protein
VLLLASAAAAGAADRDDPPRLLSFAIRGGASLGAYEAGLNWGGIEILSGRSQRDTAPVGHLRTFEPASFAGTSAGSINALMSGLVWCARPESEGGFPNRVDDNLFRNVWVSIDVNELLPPRADSPLYRDDDALLARKTLLDAAEMLHRHWRMPAFRPGCRAPIGASVTRVVPDVLRVEDVDVQNQRFYIPFELRVAKDGRAGFFFDPADYPTLVDPAMIPLPRAVDEPAASIADERVIDALLASAAVPLGFGRKRLNYCRLKPGVIVGDAPAAAAPAAPAVKEPLLCPVGYELTEAEFADGGLFDNLPIGLARLLAEANQRAAANPLPVLYVYLDPDRTRYTAPTPQLGSACEGPEPPAACRQLDYGFQSESRLLAGALGTARRYELYREFTSDQWTLGLPDLAVAVARRLEESQRRVDCREALPYFETDLSCAEALRHGAQLLERAYGLRAAPVASPYSARRLEAAGVARGCRPLAPGRERADQQVCTFDAARLRDGLARAATSALQQARLTGDPLMQRVQRSRLDMRNDRSLRVSSRGAPVTGSLLSSFGAFLERKFREYDYYVGVYDAVVAVSEAVCRIQFPSAREGAAQRRCLDATSRELYAQLGIAQDARGRYVFATLARAEFGSSGHLRYAYDPMPAEDRDMRIIYEGLAKSLEAGYFSPEASQSAFFVETVFFNHLKTAGFVPTPTADGREPLLAQVMLDPEQWEYELVRRATGRLVQLEQNARGIFAAREPDPAKRETSIVGVMGASSHVLRAATYKYPDFTFAPSTAPEEWWLRNVIPYELGLDTVEGDVLITWLPTWSMSPHTLLSLRGGFGFSRGFLDAKGEQERGNYALLGPELNLLTGRQLLSSWGLMAGVYYAFDTPLSGNRESLGGGVHVGLFKDRVRLSLGSRNLDEASDNWFLIIGITDLPGLTYWLTR